MSSIRAVFYVRKVNTETGEVTHNRSFVRDDVKNPFAYRKGLLRNEEATADETEKVTVGFDANPAQLAKWMEENPRPTDHA